VVAGVLAVLTLRRGGVRPVVQLAAALFLAFAFGFLLSHISGQLRPFQTHQVHQLIAHDPGVSLVLAVVLVALVILGVVAAVTGRLGVGRAVVTASARAVLQLGLVSLLIAAVLRA
jgi:undecaprenyl-diphosphatase